MPDQTYPVSGTTPFVLNPAADFPNPPHPDRLPFMPIDPIDPSRAILELSNPNEPGTPAAEAVQASAEKYAELELAGATDETNLVGAGTFSASNRDSDPLGYASWGLRGGEFNPPGAMDFDDVKAELKAAAQENAEAVRTAQSDALQARSAVASRSTKSASAPTPAEPRPVANIGLIEESRPATRPTRSSSEKP